MILPGPKDFREQPFVAEGPLTVSPDSGLFSVAGLRVELQQVECERPSCGEALDLGDRARLTKHRSTNDFIEHASHPTCQAVSGSGLLCMIHELDPDAPTDRCGGYESVWAGSRNGHG